MNKKNVLMIAMGMEFAKITNVFALMDTLVKTVLYMNVLIIARNMGIAIVKQASALAIKAFMGLIVAKKNVRIIAPIREFVIMTPVFASVMRIMKEKTVLIKNVRISVQATEYARMGNASALKALLAMIVQQKSVRLIALIMDFV